MLKKKKILCLVTARSGSKGLKNKNIKILNNRPLLSYPIQAAKKSKFIDDIYISTDSKKYANIANLYGAKVPFIRPKKLSGDKISSYSVIKHFFKYTVMQKIFFDVLILLEPTSPITSHKDIDRALKIFFKRFKYIDSLVTIGKLEKFDKNSIFELKKNNIIDLHSSLKKNLNSLRQSKKKEYFLDGSLYICKINKFMINKGFISKKTFGLTLDKWKNFEVDDKIDLKIVSVVSKIFKKNE